MPVPAGGNPRRAGPLVFQVDAAKLPSADSIKALLFPSIFTVEVDDQEIRFVSRSAFPALGDPSKATAMAGILPSMMGKVLPSAIQASRRAGRSRRDGSSSRGRGPAPNRGAGAGGFQGGGRRSHREDRPIAESEDRGPIDDDSRSLTPPKPD